MGRNFVFTTSCSQGLSMSNEIFCSLTSGSTHSSAPCTQLWAEAAGLSFNSTPRTRCRFGWERKSISEEYTFRWKWSPQLAWKLASLEALLSIIPTPQRFSRNYHVNVIFNAFTPGQEIFPRLDDRRSPASTSCSWRGDRSSQCWSQVCW